MRYRKQPVDVEAEQVTWANWAAVCELLGDAMPEQAYGVYLDDDGDILPGEETSDHLGLVVHTVHGEQAIVREGDWVIRDAAPGTFYPCKTDVFAATYRPAPDPSPFVQITCEPGDGILTVSPETVAALDLLAVTLTGDEHWQIDVGIGWTAADTIHLTARPGITEGTTRP